MPDMYCLSFDEKNKIINFKRDIEVLKKYLLFNYDRTNK